MKNFFYNIGYFLRETFKIIKLNLLSNLISILGTGLILFILGMVLAGGAIGNELVSKLSEEAEINAYFDQKLSTQEAEALTASLKEIEGVRDTRLVDETEAKERMKETLGEESRILELFEENPFEAFIEIRIQIEAVDTVLEQVKTMAGIEYVRDNKSVLEQIKGITKALWLLGYFVMIAVGFTTVIILSHMIRQGIYNNKDQINTLRLLGAPNGFIGFPYVLVGLLLTLCGGLLASGLIVWLIHSAYHQIGGNVPFLPLPSKEALITRLMILIPSVSLSLGFLGSLFGLSSIKDKDSNK